MNQVVIIRNAKKTDIPRLIELDEEVFGKDGVDTYGEAHFTSWLENYPEGFFVAVLDGTIVAAAHTQAITFSNDAPPKWQTYKEITDNGYARATHDPNGTHHFGLTICSVHKGAGIPLIARFLEFSRERNRPQLGVARVPGMAEYLASFGDEPDMDTQHARALHYVHESIRLEGGMALPSLFEGYVADRFPPITKPDPVLKVYMRNRAFAFFRLLPNFWHDEKCAGYSVLFGQHDCN